MEMSPQETVTLKACVLKVCPCELLVCDLCTCQQVSVHTPDACCFRPGERVCVTYDGAMTHSLPPQVTAQQVERMCGS